MSSGFESIGVEKDLANRAAIPYMTTIPLAEARAQPGRVSTLAEVEAEMRSLGRLSE